MEISSSDAELVRNLRDGDVKAFDLLYLRYSTRLHSFGFKYLRSQEEAEELVQSVFLRLWEKRRTLDPSLSFKSFLFTIAYHDICKLFRSRKYFRELTAQLLMENSAVTNDPADHFANTSLLERVYQLVDNLPEKQRAVFLKSRKEGKTAREIATELGLSAGSVDNYNSATLRYLRMHLKAEGFSTILLMCILGRV